MNKPPPPPQAQMMQQHSPIAIAAPQHPQTTAVVNSGLTTKDFLPSLQHSQVSTYSSYESPTPTHPSLEYCKSFDVMRTFLIHHSFTLCDAIGDGLIVGCRIGIALNFNFSFCRHGNVLKHFCLCSFDHTRRCFSISVHISTLKNSILLKYSLETHKELQSLFQTNLRYAWHEEQSE